MKQTTLAGSFTLKGKGLHTGLEITATFNPAPVNHGYKFQRIDLEDKPIINALAENVVNTTRGTVLGTNDVTVSTVEHALAALYALGIDNCLIEINASELPILDGSSIEYVKKIKETGFVEQDKDKDFYIVRKKIEVKDPETGSKLIMLPDDGFCVNSFIEFDSKYIPNQSATLDDINDFEKEIAPARTFVFVREVQALRKAGLIKGGDLDNAIVIAENEISGDELEKLEAVFGKSRDGFIEKGYINIDKLKFNNECARHKLLDLIGDLALCGKRIRGRVVAHRPGHRINTETAKILIKMAKERKETEGIPVFDPNAEPVIDINGIKKLLPHRPPFLMVDRIISMEKETVVGIKTIGVNEGFFIGHFPDEPVMPGVLIIEAMAQEESWYSPTWRNLRNIQLTLQK